MEQVKSPSSATSPAKLIIPVKTPKTPVTISRYLKPITPPNNGNNTSAGEKNQTTNGTASSTPENNKQPQSTQSSSTEKKATQKRRKASTPSSAESSASEERKTKKAKTKSASTNSASTSASAETAAVDIDLSMLSELESVMNKVDREQELAAQVAALSESNRVLDRSFEGQRTENERLEKRIRDLHATIDDLQSKLDNLNTLEMEHRVVVRQRDTLQEKYDALRRQNPHLQSPNIKSPANKQSSSSLQQQQQQQQQQQHEALIDEFRKKLEESQNLTATLKTELESERAKSQELAQRLATIDDYINQQSLISKSSSDTDAGIGSTSAGAGDVNPSLPSEVQQIGELLNNLHQRFNGLKSQLDGQQQHTAASTSQSQVQKPKTQLAASRKPPISSDAITFADADQLKAKQQQQSARFPATPALARRAAQRAATSAATVSTPAPTPASARKPIGRTAATLQRKPSASTSQFRGKQVVTKPANETEAAAIAEIEAEIATMTEDGGEEACTESQQPPAVASVESQSSTSRDNRHANGDDDETISIGESFFKESYENYLPAPCDDSDDNNSNTANEEGHNRINGGQTVASAVFSKNKQLHNINTNRSNRTPAAVASTPMAASKKRPAAAPATATKSVRVVTEVDDESDTAGSSQSHREKMATQAHILRSASKSTSHMRQTPARASSSTATPYQNRGRTPATDTAAARANGKAAVKSRANLHLVSSTPTVGNKSQSALAKGKAVVPSSTSVQPTTTNSSLGSMDALDAFTQQSL